MDFKALYALGCGIDPTAHTEAATLDNLESFATTTLGKGVVRAKDTPNFIANRVGVYSQTLGSDGRSAKIRFGL